MFLDDTKLTDSFKFDLLYDVYYLSDLNIISPALTTDNPNNYEYMLQIQQSEYDPSSLFLEDQGNLHLRILLLFYVHENISKILRNISNGEYQMDAGNRFGP